MRRFVIAAVLVAGLFPVGPAWTAPDSPIISEIAAARHGLTRPWFAQIQLDRSQGRVRFIVLHEDVLYVQTDRATVHAIDAETGETLWARQVGRPNHPSMTPGLNRDLLAVVNGSRLYVCNRFNGDLLFKVEVGGAPGAGPALSKRRAYVPMVNGMVMAYRLEPLVDPLFELGKKTNPTAEETEAHEEMRRENIRVNQQYVPPLSCQSLGKALVQPLVTFENEGDEFVAWPTDRGFLNIGRIDLRREDGFAVKYRLETDAAITARPTYLPPNPAIAGDSGLIFGASRDGFVYAVREKNGETLWRFSTGEPIIQPAVVVGSRVYVATQLGGMYCLDAKTSDEIWWTRGVTQFIAASKQRIYAADKLGRIRVLSAQTGMRLDTIDASLLPMRMINAQTDRIYLATTTGLIQCLHEVELTEPIRHLDTRAEAAPGAGDQPGDPPPGGQPVKQPGAGEKDPLAPADGDNPFGDDAGGGDAGGDAGGGADDADPFGGGDAGGGGGAGADADNPFGNPF